MEIRGLTFRFSKLKAKRNRDEEKLLTSRFSQLSAKLQTALLSDSGSVMQLFELLFERCSGLKTNESKSELYGLVDGAIEKIKF